MINAFINKRHVRCQTSDAGNTRMIGEKNYDDMLSRFHSIPERNGQTDGRSDGQTDIFAISISRVSMLTRDKKGEKEAKGDDHLYHLQSITNVS